MRDWNRRTIFQVESSQPIPMGIAIGLEKISSFQMECEKCHTRILRHKDRGEGENVKRKLRIFEIGIRLLYLID